MIERDIITQQECFDEMKTVIIEMITKKGIQNESLIKFIVKDLQNMIGPYFCNPGRENRWNVNHLLFKKCQEIVEKRYAEWVGITMDLKYDKEKEVYVDPPRLVSEGPGKINRRRGEKFGLDDFEEEEDFPIKKKK